jgi:hypothetical protein
MMMTYDCAAMKDIENPPVFSENVADTFIVQGVEDSRRRTKI